MVIVDRRQHMVGGTVGDHHHTAGVGESIEHGIDAADVIEKQKADGSQAMPGDLEFIQQPRKIVDRGLALAGGAR